MVFRPAKRGREPAIPMQPIVDPAGWYPADLAANQDWIYTLTDIEIAEVLATVGSIEARGLGILDIGRGDIEMPRFDQTLAMLYDELLEGRGFFLLRGVPLADLTTSQAAVAYWAIGTRFGLPVSQNNKSHMLGHVKNFGGDYAAADVRGYQTNAELNFHCDQCDYVALLCMHPAKSGGASRIASNVTVYNEMLKSCPELVQELIADFYISRHGEVSPGQEPWYKLPVFSFYEGYFSARGASGHALKALDIPGVPPFTDTQRAAFKAFGEIVRHHYFDMDFRPGDIQILHNHVTLHTRTAFEDWPEPERKRHLIRLWLTDWTGRRLKPGFRENIQGVNFAGVAPQAPVNVFEPA
ncbi:TauD/TfdA family dioxygenase [Alphaproteobacteria bacterium]|nr:TauD/TfdA family dioxygenase [Alphaproteobacteria bacterium]